MPSLVNLDLNLLVTLDAVLHTQSVTRAAEQLGVTQPAVSATLGRLRRHFGDEILHRAGNRYLLNPFAVDLRQRTHLALAGVERVFASCAALDVAESTREFSLILSDYATAVLGPRLTALVTTAAPQARLRFIGISTDLVERAEQNLTAADVMLVPHGFITELPNTDVFRDQWVIVADVDHDFDGGSPTVADLRVLPWVLIYSSHTASTPAAQRLSMTGIEPQVVVTTESFLTVRSLVVGTNRIALIPRGVLTVTGMSDGLTAYPSPVDLGPLVQAMWWHPVNEQDAEHRFLRESLMRAAAEISGPQTPAL